MRFYITRHNSLFSLLVRVRALRLAMKFWQSRDVDDKPNWVNGIFRSSLEVSGHDLYIPNKGVDIF